MDTARTEIMPAATWDAARDLLDAAKTGAMAWRDLGAVLEELREQHYAERAGAGRPRKIAAHGEPQFSTSGPGRGKKQSAHDEPTVFEPKKAEAGWQAIVVEQLGISLATAKRLLADARCYRQMLAISAGEQKTIETTEQDLDRAGNVVRRKVVQPVTESIIQESERALKEMEKDPQVRPARMWAGVVGGAATKGTQRATPDDLALIEKACRAMPGHWRRLVGLQPERATRALTAAIMDLPLAVQDALRQALGGGRE